MLSSGGDAVGCILGDGVATESGGSDIFVCCIWRGFVLRFKAGVTTGSKLYFLYVSTASADVDAFELEGSEPEDDESDDDVDESDDVDDSDDDDDNVENGDSAYPLMLAMLLPDDPFSMIDVVLDDGNKDGSSLFNADALRACTIRRPFVLPFCAPGCNGG